MPRLVSISWRNAPGLIGLRASTLQTFEIGKLTGTLAGWRVIVSGPMLLLISPPGWQAGDAYAARSEAGDRTVFELARADATLKWAFDDGETPGPVKEWIQPEPEIVPPVAEIVVPHREPPIVGYAELDEPVVSARRKARP